MKILFCTNTFENVQNGPTKFANYLLEINSRYKNVEIRILTEDIDLSKVAAYHGQVVQINPRVNFLTKPWGFLYRMFPYYKACKKIRSEYPYDIVVFNNAITGIWAARKLPVPVIGMINDYTSLTNSWSTFEVSWQWLRRCIFKYSEQLACSVEDGILVNSEFLFNKVLEAYKVPFDRLKIVSRGLRIEPLRDIWQRVSRQPFKVLFVKSDYALGGLFDVMNALGIMKEYTFDLYVVGPNLHFREHIIQSNQSKNVNVIFIGPTNERQVYALMRSCDLFVVPSYKEALGVANLEALMNGIPVITSQIGGIPETMDNGNNGWMVQPGDIQKLADTIRNVIRNPEERHEKQRRGYNFVCERFSIEKVLDQFIKVLQEFHENYIRVEQLG